MKVERAPLNGLLVFTPKIISDSRGFFLETYRESALAEAIGKDVRFCQDNKSHSNAPGTIRGLHVQLPPHGQGKLITCLSGEFFDVAVDVRRDSPTYGQWFGATLSAENHKQLWIPQGFLNGFQTTRADTIISYKCTHYYNRQSERAIAWNDPDLDIKWKELDPILSDKDLGAPSFNSFESPF